MKGKFGRMSVFLANLLLLLLLNCVSAVTDTDHEMCSCLLQPSLFSISCCIRLKSVWSVLIKSMAINLKRKCHQSDVAIYFSQAGHAHVCIRQLNHDFHGFQSTRRYDKWWPLKLARHDVYNVQCHHTNDYVRHCDQRHPHAALWHFCSVWRCEYRDPWSHLVECTLLRRDEQNVLNVPQCIAYVNPMPFEFALFGKFSLLRKFSLSLRIEMVPRNSRI